MNYINKAAKRIPAHRILAQSERTMNFFQLCKQHPGMAYAIDLNGFIKYMLGSLYLMRILMPYYYAYKMYVCKIHMTYMREGE